MAVRASEIAGDAATGVEVVGSSWTRRDRFRLDSVRYDVYVVAQNGGFFGGWACLECGDHGTDRLNDSTPDAASARAQLGLNHHHNQFHRPLRKPK